MAIGTTVTGDDQEIEALGTCVAALYPLNEDAIRRVLQYLQARLVKVPPVPTTSCFPFVSGSSLPADCR